jgi:hypothetical protein
MYVTVLRCAIWLAVIMSGTICSTHGLANFHSLKRAPRDPITTTPNNNKTKINIVIVILIISRLGLDLYKYKAAGAEVAVVTPTQVRSAKRRSPRRMPPQTMADTDTQPSDTRARGRRRTQVQTQARARRPIQTFGIPTAPSSSRSGTRSSSCTSRRCRSTRPTLLPCSGARVKISVADARSSRSKTTSGAQSATSPSIALPRRPRTTLRRC